MKKLITSLLFIFHFFNANSQTYIIGYEYWCDTAYDSRIYVSTGPYQQLSVDTMLGFPGLEKGLHLLNIRFQQTNDFWSQTISEYFFKTGEGPLSEGRISAYRYWVEGVDTIMTYELTTPVKQYDLNVSLDLTWVPRGSNFLYIQFRDEQNNWSVTTVDSFYKSSLLIANFNSPDTLKCGSDSVHFFNLSVDADIFLWQFGDGDTSTAKNPVHLYQQPGTYTVTLTATDTIAGIDSTIILTDYIHIAQAAQASFNFTQVGLNITFINTSTNAISYRWEFGDGDISYLENTVHTYPQNGNYTAILIAYDSCGSSSDTQIVSIVVGVEKLFEPGDIIVSQTYDKLNIQVNKNLDNCIIVLQNSSGQIVYRKELLRIFYGSTESVYTSYLSTGIYFLTVIDANATLRKKVFIGN